MNSLWRSCLLLTACAALVSAQPAVREHSQQLALRTQELPDAQPQVKKRVNPVYPEILMRANVQGNAYIRLVLDESGRIDSAIVLKASHEALGASALEAAKQWEFSPAMKAGKAIRSEVVVPFNFKLNAEDEFYGLQTIAKDILTGKFTDKLKNEIDPEALAVVGRTSGSLWSILFDKKAPVQLIEGEKTSFLFSSLKADDSKKSVVLLLKSRPPKQKTENFHTIVFMKNRDGVWKIKSWHTSN